MVLTLASSIAFAQSEDQDLWRHEIESQPLFILDDKIITSDDLNSPNLDPTQIAKIKVIKPKNAIEQYGEQGKNGVVIITSKEKENQLFSDKPLFVLDGEIIAQADFSIDGLDQNNIESLQVVKGKPAIDQYGEKGRNGVILITTKKK